MADGEGAGNLIADLVKPGVLVAFQLADGSTCRARFEHDGKRPLIEDLWDTLAHLNETGQMLQVDSWDDDEGTSMDIWIVPSQVVGVKVERAFTVVEAVA